MSEAAAWSKVRTALEGADSVAFDGCHKIYVLMDEEQTDLMRDWGYDDGGSSLLEVSDADEALSTVKGWWEDSCGLRFVSAVKSPGKNEDFENLISQFEEEDW